MKWFIISLAICIAISVSGCSGEMRYPIQQVAYPPQSGCIYQPRLNIRGEIPTPGYMTPWRD